MRFGMTITGAASNLAAQGIPFLLLLIVTPILLSALGRERYGALILFNLVPQIAGQLDLGIATAATRGYTQHAARGDHDGARRLFREAFALMVGWGVLLAGLFYLAHDRIADALKIDTVVADDSWIYLAATAAIVFALANNAALLPLRALERYGAMARIQVVTGVTYWLVCAWWAPRGASLSNLVVIGTVSVAIATVALVIAGRMTDHGRRARGVNEELSIAPDNVPVVTAGPTRDTWLLRPFLKLGAGAFVAQASSLATYHADKLLVSALVSPAAAGAYAICTSIANKILLVVASGATFTFPRAARFHAEGDLARVAETYAFGTRMSMLIAACLATPLIALAPAFLSIWIGPDFAADYGATLQILAIGYALTAGSVVASNIAVGIGEATLPAFFALLGGTMTLISVAILAPRYGAAGAAGAALIGMSQSLLFNALIGRRVGGSTATSTWALCGRILCVALPIGLASAAAGGLVTGWVSLISLGCVVVAVFVTVWLLTFGREEERTLLRELLVRIGLFGGVTH